MSDTRHYVAVSLTSGPIPKFACTRGQFERDFGFRGRTTGRW
jgi:hypothetical protein